MPGSRRDEEFSAFVQDHRIDMLRAACLLAAGDTHRAEDLVQTALARLYVDGLGCGAPAAKPPMYGASSSTHT